MLLSVPPGHTKVKIVKPVTYARTELSVGAEAYLDTETANRLIKERRAALVEAGPARAMIATICPKCQSAMEYPETPETSERWTQCGNPACGHGWLR